MRTLHLEFSSLCLLSRAVPPRLCLSLIPYTSRPRAYFVPGFLPFSIYRLFSRAWVKFKSSRLIGSKGISCSPWHRILHNLLIEISFKKRNVLGIILSWKLIVKVSRGQVEQSNRRNYGKIHFARYSDIPFNRAPSEIIVLPGKLFAEIVTGSRTGGAKFKAKLWPHCSHTFSVSSDSLSNMEFR